MLSAPTRALFLAAVLVCAISTRADAFCGFYINGAGADMFNEATMTVLMRDGTRTVLSMQNNYAGPPEDFAMVVPVPVVLHEEDVKTLPAGIFARVDKLSAPRLVEYWEMDPCAPEVYPMAVRSARPMTKSSMKKTKSADLGVTIEAEFVVGEYKIVILSAKDSGGLDTWLRREGYKIPAGAAPVLKPYVTAGMKFFVAKVDVKKVKFEDGRAKLSPLRFHYDSDEFSLPVRLGLLNSKGMQDLIIHILAPGRRYEVANYDNVTIPTNIDVEEAARDSFGPFYAALFDKTLAANPGSVVTEYSWDANSCDPCPSPALTGAELVTLGADVLHTPASTGATKSKKIKSAKRPPFRTSGFVLTRLHARYSKDTLGEDLIFREAKPITGGREFPDSSGGLEKGSKPGGVNNFQGRYAIRHKWTGVVECKDPKFGRWGGPPADVKRDTKVKPATDLAFVARGSVSLASMVREDIPELKVKAGVPEPRGDEGTGATTGDTGSGGVDEPLPPPSESAKGKKGCTVIRVPGDGPAPGGIALLLLVGLATGWRAVRRRRSPGPSRGTAPPR